ncbi:hypothetical protein MTO96_014979 [Rhipicephalus appendiculatus]
MHSHSTGTERARDYKSPESREKEERVRRVEYSTRVKESGGRTQKKRHVPRTPRAPSARGGKNGTAAAQEEGAKRIPYARIDTLNEFVRGEPHGRALAQQPPVRRVRARRPSGDVPRGRFASHARVPRKAAGLTKGVDERAVLAVLGSFS